MTGAEGRGLAERWLAEARVSRDSLTLALPPSRLALGAGDVVRFANADWRIDRLHDKGPLALQATRIAAGQQQASAAVERLVDVVNFVPPVPVFPVFMDLPLLKGDEVPYAPWLAITAQPWPGSAAIWASSDDSGYELESLRDTPSTLGMTQNAIFAAPSGRFDRKTRLQVTLTRGELVSVTRQLLLKGSNTAVIGDGTTGNWEVFQFETAALVAPQTYELSGLLRGQAGTDAVAPTTWPSGSLFVLLDATIEQVALNLGERRLSRHYRIGPAGRAYDDAAYAHLELAFDGIGLRPLSPCHLRATPLGGDLSLNWTRRTRINGDSWESADVPLGETTESYRVRVVRGASTLREVTVTAPSWTYTAALQTTDGAGPVSIDVAQIGEIWGAGADATIDLTI